MTSFVTNIPGFQWILKGGWMMAPLLFSGALVLAVLLERLWVFYSYQKTISSRDLLRTLQKILNEVPTTPAASALFPKELADFLNQEKKSFSPFLTLLQTAEKHWESPLEEMDFCLKNQIDTWKPRLEKRLAWVDTAITAAPLLGLLGTITGMMSSFEVLSAKGLSEIHAITGGIAEALIATATGLMVAILGLLGYNHFTHQIQQWISELETVTSLLIEYRLALQRHSKKREPHAAPLPSLS